MLLVNGFFEAKLDQLMEVLTRAAALLDESSVEYQVSGGMAVYLHVDPIDPLHARLTPDLDICVRRDDLATIIDLAAKHRFQFIDPNTLRDLHEPKAHSAVHFIFTGDLIRANELAVVPHIAQPVHLGRFKIAPVSDLLIMKLTSNRFKDMAHIRDMLNVDLITPEMEAAIPASLRERFDFIKSHE